MATSKRVQKIKQKELLKNTTTVTEHWLDTNRRQNFIVKPKEVIAIFNKFKEDYFSVGKPITRTEFAVHLKVSEDYFFKTLLDDKDYHEVVADIDQQIKNNLVSNALQKKYDTTFVIFYMKNTYDWKDNRQNNDKPTSVNIQFNIPQRPNKTIEV